MAMKKMNESYQTISSVSTVSTASVAPSSSAVFPRNGDTISMNVISTLSTQFHTKHDIENAFESTCIICLGHFSRFNPPFHIPCQGTCRFASEYVHGECIHQWKITKENRDEAPSCPLCRDDLCSFSIVHLGQPPSSRVLEIDAIARRKFITSPLLKSFGVVRCYIRVKKQSRCSLIKHKSIELFYQTSEYKDGTYLPKVDYPKRSDSFLLFAENKGLINDSYSISCDIERKDVDHHNVLGTLNSNIRRNEYTLTSPLEGKREMELAGISINRNQSGKGSSSKTIQMNVCTPGIAECNEEDDDVKFNFCEDGENDKEDKDFYTHWKILDMPKGQSEQSLLQRAKQLNKEREIVQTSKITKLSVNEQPRWNDDLQAYSMDFDGRYMLPSRKNFKLISSTSSTLDKSRVEIQFGKILKSDDTSVYAMDVQWPMSLLQAFSICLTRL